MVLRGSLKSGTAWESVLRGNLKASTDVGDSGTGAGSLVLTWGRVVLGAGSLELTWEIVVLGTGVCLVLTWVAPVPGKGSKLWRKLNKSLKNLTLERYIEKQPAAAVRFAPAARVIAFDFAARVMPCVRCCTSRAASGTAAARRHPVLA
eukprot:882662-Rhodomonas_salina.7